MINSENKSVPSARILAYQALYDILEKDAYANLTIQHILRSYDLKEAETHLLTELVYGVLRRYNYIIWIISKLSTRPVKKLHPSVRIIICLGLYQLLYLTRIPESAAVNESVKIAKKVTHRGNASFINAILRSYLRKKDEIKLIERHQDPILHDSLFYSEQEWLIRLFRKSYEEESTFRILESFNQTPFMTVRINTHKISIINLVRKLEEKGINAETVSWKSDALIIRKGAYSIWEFVEKGYVYVQSLSSMIPADVLCPQKNDKVLDMCAAPGSKTTQMSVFMEDTGSIDAWDLYSHKISLIKTNAEKLGLSNIRAQVRDSSILHDDSIDYYDRILLDAPCSGLGVLSHKPEIRWRRTEKDLEEFPQIQRKLLNCAARYLKKGGTLVYSTCTLNPKENEDMVQLFLSDHKDFRTQDFVIENLKSSKDGMMTILPDELESDGFFIARLIKE